MTTDTRNHLRDAAADAADTVRHFADEILEQLLDNGEASDDLLNDYPNGDAWHHESHVDKCYSLIDAAEVLDQLMDFEETDSGLWEGQAPKEAVSTMAAFTYGNAVYNEFQELIERINEEAADIIDEYDEKIAKAEDAEDAEKNLETLEEERKEALRKLIEETADNA